MRRIEQLDGVRAVAFLLVYLNHSIYVPMAWVGVDLFFVLSGFLITNILLDSKGVKVGSYFARFYQRRARRILPAYLLVLAFVVVIIPPPDWNRVWWQFLTFCQNVGVAIGLREGVLIPYWSLAVEEQFYLLWPIVVYTVGRRGLIRTCVGLLLLAPVLRAVFTPRVELYETIFTLTPFRMDLLAGGALLGLIWRENEQLIRRFHRPITAVAAISGLAFVIPAAVSSSWRASAHSFAFNVLGYSLSVVFFSTFLALVLVVRWQWLQGPLRNRWMRELGKISYMCYLVHEPVLYFTLPLGRVIGSVLGLVVTVGISALSWRFIESPILNAGKPSLATV